MGTRSAARTFDHRREAYADFYESLPQMALHAYEHGIGLSLSEKLGEWQFPTFRKLQHLRLYATASVAEAALAAYDRAYAWGARTTYGRDDDKFYERQEAYDDAEAELLSRMRADLSIPDS